jgi:hypothetical protein
MVTFSFDTTTITLRDPDFDNIERIEISRINMKNRGGDLIIFRDPLWPTTRVLDMKFSFLSEDQTRALLSFLDMSLGQIVTHVDFEGRTWTGIITTPLGDVVQPGRENKTAHIVFQGELS